MPNPDRTAAYKLIHDAILVQFEIVEKHIEPSLGDEGNSIVRIELRLGGPAEDEDQGDGGDDIDSEEEREDAAADQAEWAGFGFIFTLATLSFGDARPRAYTGPNFVEKDEFTITDLFEGLKFVHGELHFSADYIRDRCIKTHITVRRDGRVTLETTNRGEAATRWLDRLKGNKMMAVVE